MEAVKNATSVLGKQTRNQHAVLSSLAFVLVLIRAKTPTRNRTENTAMIAGLGAACALVSANLAEYAAHMLAMRDYFEAQMLARFSRHRFCVNGSIAQGARLPNTSNFSLLGQGLNGSHVLAASKTFYASVGAACHSEHTMR